MLETIVTVALITLIIVAPMIGLAICKVRKEFRDGDDKN